MQERLVSYACLVNFVIGDYAKHGNRGALTLSYLSCLSRSVGSGVPLEKRVFVEARGQPIGFEFQDFKPDRFLNDLLNHFHCSGCCAAAFNRSIVYMVPRMAPCGFW
jgi:hypothetical protein